jgi:hypothetical protein
MSRKQSVAVCLLFKGGHYSFPIGSVKQGSEGDSYWGLGEKGEHLSFHKSGQVHYKDENRNLVLLNEPGSIKLYIEMYEPMFELFKDMNSPEKKFILNLIKHLEPSIKVNGCFDPICRNRLGMAIKFDELLELLTQYLNENKKQCFQIFGPIENEYDPNEDEEEDEPEHNNKLTNVIFPHMDIEKISECKYCIGKKYIQYDKKKRKFYWVKCPRCGGIGLDVGRLEEYRSNCKI